MFGENISKIGSGAFENNNINVVLIPDGIDVCDTAFDEDVDIMC